jgi:hypothetical protein
MKEKGENIYLLLNMKNKNFCILNLYFDKK